VQVKYEMLRKVRLDGDPVSRAAADFGFSRVALYAALAAFDSKGLAGLVPRKRGPRQGHKLTDAVVDFIHDQLAQDPSLDIAALSGLVGKHFGCSVHPRSIERVLRKKTSGVRNLKSSESMVDAYESLRSQRYSSTTWERTLLTRRGVLAWMEA
jgi:transposase